MNAGEMSIRQVLINFWALSRKLHRLLPMSLVVENIWVEGKIFKCLSGYEQQRLTLLVY